MEQRHVADDRAPEFGDDRVEEVAAYHPISESSGVFNIG